jgi:hypothetical protein
MNGPEDHEETIFEAAAELPVEKRSTSTTAATVTLRCDGASLQIQKEASLRAPAEFH